MTSRSISRRLAMLESITASDGPMIIFIVGIETDGDQIVGILATFRGKHYEFAGNNVSAMLTEAELMFEYMLGESRCDLVFVKRLVKT